MIENHPDARQRYSDQVGYGLFSTLVLAEGDDDMWLATVGFTEPPQPGSTFHFRGEVWQVVWREDFGCRAEPAVM